MNRNIKKIGCWFLIEVDVCFREKCTCVQVKAMSNIFLKIQGALSLLFGSRNMFKGCNVKSSCAQLRAISIFRMYLVKTRDKKPCGPLTFPKNFSFLASTISAWWCFNLVLRSSSARDFIYENAFCRTALDQTWKSGEHRKRCFLNFCEFAKI